MSLSGGQLSGGNSATERAENDFYATNPIAVSKLIESLYRDGVCYSLAKCLEPSVGTGNICNVFDYAHCMFLKLQFLEGIKRKDLFGKYPPKYIYVFRNRMATWKNGFEKNPDTGKKWAETICFAWFIWVKGSTTEPVIRWID